MVRKTAQAGGAPVGGEHDLLEHRSRDVEIDLAADKAAGYICFTRATNPVKPDLYRLVFDAGKRDWAIHLDLDLGIGLGPMSEVLLVPGIQLAGPYPPGLQSYLVFMACISSASKNGDAARSLVKFLSAPAAAPVFKDKDMEPG